MAVEGSKNVNDVSYDFEIPNTARKLILFLCLRMNTFRDHRKTPWDLKILMIVRFMQF